MLLCSVCSCRNTVIPASVSINSFYVSRKKREHWAMTQPFFHRWSDDDVCARRSGKKTFHNKLFYKDSLHHFMCRSKRYIKLFIPFEPQKNLTHIWLFPFLINLACQGLFFASSFKFMMIEIIRLGCYLPVILKYIQQSGWSWQRLAHQWEAEKTKSALLAWISVASISRRLKSCNIGYYPQRLNAPWNNQLPPRLMFTVAQGFNEAAMKL